MRSIQRQFGYPRLPAITLYRHHVATVYLLGLIRELKRAEVASYTASSQQWISRNNAAIVAKQIILTTAANGTNNGHLDVAAIISDIEWLRKENENFRAGRRERQTSLARTEVEGRTAELELQQRWET
nr:hypothetical protein CFP56_78811 [Quercus suber]